MRPGNSLLLAAVFMCSLSLQVRGTSPVATGGCADLLPVGERLIAEGKPDSAILIYRQAAKCFAEREQWVPWARAMKGVGASQLRMGKYEDAVASFNQLLRRRDQVSALLPPGDVFIGWVYVNKGAGLKRLGWFSEAREAYEQAAAVFRENNVEDFNVASFCYRDLGNIYTRFGEYEKALWYLQQLKRISMEAGMYNAVADACGDISIVYYVTGDFARSGQSCNEGLALSSLAPRSVAALESNAAATSLAMKRYDEAIEHIRRSNDIYKHLLSIESDKHPLFDFLGGSHELWGSIYAEQHFFAEAGQHYKKALDYYHRAYGTQHRQIAKTYLALGRLYTGKSAVTSSPDDIGTALTYFAQALGALIHGFQPAAHKLFPHPDELYPENTFLDVFEGIGKACEARYRTSHNLSDLEQAFEAYLMAIRADEVLRNDLDFETSKLTLAAENHRRIESAMRLGMLLYEDALNTRPQKARHYLESVFAISESNRSILLMEALRDARARAKGNVPDSLIRHEKKLRRAIARTKTALYRQSHPGSLADSLILLQSNHADLMAMIRSSYPAYSSGGTDLKPPDIETAQKIILQDNGTCLIEYFQGEDALYMLVLTSDHAFFLRQPVAASHLDTLVKELLAAITGYENATGDHNKQRYLQSAHELYSLLVQPCLQKAGESATRNMIIVPDGALARIPFDALLQKMPPHPQEARYDALDYLLRNYTISYAYSAATLADFYGIEEAANPARYPFCGFAPHFNQPGWHLPSAIAEIEHASELTGGLAFSGPTASLAKFREVAEHSRILHLATHAIIDQRNPMTSYIVFASASAEGDHDTLSLAELYSLDLNARLAVLSACNTGVGPFRKGEGLLSLASAFSYAGCRGEVMSQWILPDQSTENIMGNFYRYLVENEPIDVALQKAKLDYLDQQPFGPEFAHPFYWAGVSAIGDMRPMEPDAGWSALAYAIPLLLLAGWMMARRFKKRRDRVAEAAGSQSSTGARPFDV